MGLTLQRALDCEHRMHCLACRGSASFRQSLFAAGIVGNPDFPCPFGIAKETAMAPALRYERATWPAWARAIAAYAAPPDTGIGDTLARHFGIAGETFKSWFKSTFGKSCGCEGRQAALNLQYPYQWKPTP